MKWGEQSGERTREDDLMVFDEAHSENMPCYCCLSRKDKPEGLIDRGG
jgi:hypothetical protein